MSALPKPKTTIGIIEHVTISSYASNVPAKIDTGADSSSIWATNITVDQDGILHFNLFGPGSRYYIDTPFSRSDFSVVVVKNSTGQSEVRYRTHFTVLINGRRIKALFNLSDRSNNTYKILIGRRTISGKFLVDVSKHRSRLPVPTRSKKIRQAFRENPAQFHKTYGTLQTGDNK